MDDPLPPVSRTFLARLAHELNTPLATLRLQLDLAQDRLDAKDVQILQRNLDRLGALAKDILDYCELEAGASRIAVQEGDLVGLVRQGVEKARAKAPGVAFHLEAPGPIPCWVDPPRIGSVVDKYLDNAVRHMPDGGQVRVAVQAQNDRALVEVHDQGVGFDPAASRRLFEAFGERSARAPGHVGGLGLSLYLCRSIVARHGGHTWAVSPGPGLGATFGFALRTAQGAAPPGLAVAEKAI